jgi:hypothetical protein
MTDWKMYSEIQQKKKEGFRKTQAARKLGINFRTVDKYWDMPPDKYAHTLEDTRTRIKKGDIYVILQITSELPLQNKLAMMTP